MQSNPLVSVIVPVYGTEDYLSNCVDSICNQTCSNLQIILVDDQSPDKCPEICDNYARKDSRIVVIHQENKGVSAARNAGLDCATGEYIMFVDSDDELYPDAVSILLKDLVRYSADIVSCTKDNIFPDGRITTTGADGTCFVFKDEEPLLISLESNIYAHAVWAKLYKASFIEDLRFVEGHNLNEDGFFIFQCYMKKPTLVQHNVPIYKYNVRENSASRQVFSDKYLSMLYFCERKKSIIKEQYPQYIEQFYNNEAITNLQFLDVLCSTQNKKYKKLQKECIRTVRKLYKYHRPINKHYKMLARCVALGLYPLYKAAVRIKYYR